MEAKANELIRIMQMLLQVHMKMLDACERQRQALIDNDVKALDKAIAGLEKFIRDIEALERRRQVVAAEIAIHFHLDPDSLAVSDLGGRLDERFFRTLMQVAASLQKVLLAIRSVNDQNAMLVTQSVHYVQKVLELVSTNVSGSGYGRQAAVAGGRLMDFHA